MGEIINSISEAIGKVYQSFIIRDLLGFIFPGAIFLWSLLLINPARIPICQSVTDRIECLLLIVENNPSPWQIFIFLGIAYLTGWIVQTLHYGIVDWIFQIVKHHKFPSFIWPLAGIVLYVKAIANSNYQPNETYSLITIGALTPDKALQRVKGTKAISRFQKSSLYTERVTALMLMTGNIAIAGIPLLIVIVSELELGWQGTMIGAFILLLIYLEHWRLFYTRNLRHELAVDAASQEIDNGPAT